MSGTWFLLFKELFLHCFDAEQGPPDRKWAMQRFYSLQGSSKMQIGEGFVKQI